MIIASIRALGNAAPPTARDWLVRLSGLPNDTFSLGFGDADVAGQVQSGLTAPLQPTSLAYALDPKNFTPTPAPDRRAPLAQDHTGTDGDTLARAHVRRRTAAADARAAHRVGLLADAASRGRAMRPCDRPTSGPWCRPACRRRSSPEATPTPRRSPGHRMRPCRSAPPDCWSPISVSRMRSGRRRARRATPPGTRRCPRSTPSCMLTSTESGGPKRILVALDRSWPSSGTQLARTLASLLGTPWSVPASLADVSSATPTSGLSLTDAPEPQTRIDAIKALLQDEKALTGFSSILDAPERLTGRTRAELLTLLAVSWENPRTDWSGALTKSRADDGEDAARGADPPDRERQPRERAGLHPVHRQQRAPGRSRQRRAHRGAVEQPARDRPGCDQAHPRRLASHHAGPRQSQARQRPGRADPASVQPDRRPHRRPERRHRRRPRRLGGDRGDHPGRAAGAAVRFRNRAQHPASREHNAATITAESDDDRSAVHADEDDPRG